LTARGRAVLARLAPRPYGPDFAPSTFAGVASAQVLATFWLWSPTGIVLYEPKGAWLVAFDVAYAASWGLLVKAIADAGVGLQSGSIGWLAVLRGTRPNYGEMPRRGLFLACRQPIYLAYALTLWTGPVRTLDGLLLAVPWTAYCYFGPRLKERRYEGWFGEAFVKYRSEVPYFLPRIRRSASKSLPSKESA
jgi:protein-S-isoprenylcysteine O-methyltransferase Ste14